MPHDYLAVIAAYGQRFADEQPTAARVATFLRSTPCPGSRSHASGHVTASGIVIANGRILLIRHPGLGKWLQPGGHIEPGESPQQAALREVVEETGVPVALHPWHAGNPMPLDIDIHQIPASTTKNEAAHLHYDFRYWLQPLPATACTHMPELEMRWWPSDALPCSGLQRIVGKLLNQSLFSAQI